MRALIRLAVFMTTFAVTQGDVVTPDGAKLHFYKAGHGRTTLIVPLGFMLFDDFKQLADVATVIAYDPRGRGRSSRDTSVAPTIQQDVKDFESVRAHFGAAKVVPVGWSYLGLMVAMDAMEHPEHVARLVQLGPVAMHFDPGDVAPPEMPAKNQREACEAADRAMREALVGNPSHASRIASTCDFENEWPANLDKHFVHTFTSIKSVKIDPSKISMPVLTIHGTSDRNAAYAGGREWVASLPNARLLTIPGAAHASWVDDPATVFGAIREFVRGE